MSDAQDIRLQRKAKGARPYYFSNPDVDRLLSMIMALMGELSVTRDRLDTLERVAHSKNLFSSEDIEKYSLSPEVLEARADRHKRLFSEVTRIIVGEVEESEKNPGTPYSEAVELVEQEV